MVVPCEDSYELDPLRVMCSINFALRDFIRPLIHFMINTYFEASQFAVFSIPLSLPLTSGADILLIALFPNALSLRSCGEQRFTPMQNNR
jgi:hypothetical protein